MEPTDKVDESVVEMSLEIGEVALALSTAQGELNSAKKDTRGYGYNYSDLASVIEVAKPILAKNKLAITQLVGNAANGDPKVTTLLVHQSGQWFRSVSSMPVVDMKGCSPAQCHGATQSYLRRYAYQAIIGLASEDNDASPKGFESKEVEKPKKDTKTESKTKFNRKVRTSMKKEEAQDEWS